MARDPKAIRKTKGVQAAGQPSGGDTHVPSLVKGVAKRTKAYQSKLYSLMAGKFSADELATFKKKARAHAGGKTKADLRAGKTAAEGDDVLDEAFEIEGAPNTGLWIALKVPMTIAGQLAVIENGELAEDLHLTLAVMGDATEFSTMDLAKMMVAVEDCVRWNAPISGVVSGIGRFDNNDPEDAEDVIYASVDAPGLSSLRESIVSRLRGAGVPADETHGFDPHITLAYVAEDYATPDLELGGLPIRFGSVCVYIGDNETEIELGGATSCCGTCCAETKGEHELAELCSQNHKARLFIEYTFNSTLPEWIPFLPKPGKYVSPRYGEILITKERNANFVKNFSAGIYQEKIAIDAEHELSLSGACGWINAMRQNSDGSVDAKTDWTPRGKVLVESGQFKFISPAFFDKWVDPATEKQYSDVAYGAALTIRPFFKEKSLRPLLATENGLSEGELEGAAGSEIFKFAELKNYSSAPDYTVTAIRKALAGEAGEKIMAVTKEQIEAARKVVASADANEKKFSEKEITDARAIIAEDAAGAGEKKFTEGELEQAKKEAAEAAKAEVQTDTQKQLNEKDAANKQLSDRVASLEKSGREKRFTETAQDFVGDRPAHVEMMEFIATSDPKGEESERFQNYVKNQKAMSEQARTGKLFEEKGSSASGSIADDPVASVTALAKSFREKDDKLTEEAALQKVFSEQPELYEQYRDATTRRVG